jgi:N-acetylmuramoyl-L-alanine amidase
VQRGSPLADVSPTDQLDDRHVIALTAWGEARSLREDGIQATICVVQNRLASGVAWWGKTLRDICLKPWQFSCWNENDPNRSQMLAVSDNDPDMVMALGFADQALAGALPDNVNQADSYYDLDLKERPLWSIGRQPVAQIGTQLYFKTVERVVA